MPHGYRIHLDFCRDKKQQVFICFHIENEVDRSVKTPGGLNSPHTSLPMVAKAGTPAAHRLQPLVGAGIRENLDPADILFSQVWM